jgi:WD40 repeat protein
VHLFITKLSLLALCILIIGCSDGPTSTLLLAKQGFLSADLSTDGSKALIGSIHHGGSFWDLDKKERLFNWNHQSGKMSSLRAVAISKNGQRAVTCEEDTLVLWDANSGEYKQFWKAEDRILSIALNEKGDRALMGLRDGTVSYFDLDRGKTIYNFKHLAEVRSVSLSKDGLTGISASDDRTVKVFDLKTGTEIQTKTLNNQIKIIAISDSGNKVFATAQREDSIIWNIASDKILYKKHNRITNYTAADFSDDEQFLSLGTFTGSIIRLDINTGAELNKWQAEPRQAYGGASSKAIISLIDNNKTISVLTSDGMFESFN